MQLGSGFNPIILASSSLIIQRSFRPLPWTSGTHGSERYVLSFSFATTIAILDEITVSRTIPNPMNNSTNKMMNAGFMIFFISDFVGTVVNIPVG